MIVRFAALALPAPAPAAQPQGIPPALAQFVRTAVHDADDGIVADEVGDAWIIGNAAWGFRADFSTRGLRVTGTGEDGTPWTLGLQLVGWGRGDELQLAPGGSFRVVDRRVEIDRGSLTEWYVNDERGVEQGFTLASPPPVVDDEEGALRLVLSVAGGWTPQVRASGRDVRFTRPEVTTVIHYTGLRVWDAEGAEQDAVFVVGADRVCILVEDRGATYPLIVDPWIWTEEAALDPIDDDAWDQVGNSVGVDGDTGVVGAQDDEDVAFDAGAAYVFVRSGSTWSQQAKLLANDGESGDGFGTTVSVHGDTALVGSPGAEIGGTVMGAAYVFVRAGTTWGMQGKLTASASTPHAAYGTSVSLCGDTGLVGAPFADVAGEITGAAYAIARTAAASAVFGNAGANPASYTLSGPPVMGNTITATIDLASTGHNLALLVAYTTPLTLTLGGGQAVLVNIADPNGELLTLSPPGGPVAIYPLPVPSDIVFVGFGLSTQALHLGGVQPFALSNAQDLFLGH